MKHLLILAVIAAFLLPTNVEARHDNTPRPTPRVTTSPTGSPYATPTSSPIPQETTSPTASPSATQTPQPEETRIPEPSESPAILTIRTDLSDGRSDGRTDSLDCITRDCSGVSAPQGAVLPATGDDKWIGVVVTGLVLFTAGMLLVRYAHKMDRCSCGGKFEGYDTTHSYCDWCGKRRE